jgi:septal ring-binding cell division protein DamX
MSPDLGAIVAVHHHSAFGMHVDPVEPAAEAEAPDDDNQRPATTAAARQAAGASS